MISSGRQACAVESAARRARLPVHVVLTSPSLQLADNTTCRLYTAALPSLAWFSVTLDTIAAESPIAGYSRAKK